MPISGGSDVPAIETDPDTPVGLVRLLIADLDETNPLFTDGQILSFLAMESDSVKRAAAMGLDTIARSELLLSKKFSTQDLSVDGPAVAKELRESAKALREQAVQADVDEDGYGLDIGVMWQYPTTYPYGDCLL